MELETGKLVAFALWAESGPGVAGKSPTDLQLAKSHFDEAECEEDLYRLLGEDLAFKLINYDTVWEAAEEPEAPSPEREPIELQELTLLPKKEAPAFEEQQGPEPVEAPETPTEETPEPSVAERLDRVLTEIDQAEEAPQPKKQRGKRGK